MDYWSFPVDVDEGNSQQRRGNIPLNLERCPGNGETVCFA